MNTKDETETVTESTTSAPTPAPVQAKKSGGGKKRVMKAKKSGNGTKKAKSPQAQSGPAIDLAFGEMNKIEQKIVTAAFSKKGERKAYSIKDLMKVVGVKASSPIRNGLRKPVRGGWLEKFDRGTYRITEKARKRGLKAAAKGA
jgi:hypothetical protein